ncbi:hypothetical protein MMC08_002465 [Hypocenomyce scalaris]|nr:hypothetical protein [Hypocenomyce scalaris]
MENPQLPPISAVPSLPTAERAAILDILFEPCTQLHTLSVGLLHEKSFASYDDLIASIGIQLTDLMDSASTSDTEWLEKILASHPRLGEKKVQSAHSRAEQAKMGTTDSVQEKELTSLNTEYERTFPGLRYVWVTSRGQQASVSLAISTFVNGRDRSVIMDDMRSRITRGDIKLERGEAAKAMCEIAADRSRRLVAAP